MGYIFILRHGPTKKKDDEKILQKSKFKKIAPEIISTISKYGDVDIIYTSPADRCTDTAKILNEDLKVCIHKKNDILGCTHSSKYKKTFMTALTFARDVIKESSRNILVITHSSVLRGVLSGICDKHPTDFHIRRSSLSVYDKKKEEYVLFNQRF